MPEAGRDAPERSYRSIREVLELLVAEFPDVTISKIRFLESRGLIHPERTPSGYRKFYDADVERLRWILRQQREHFLPLKIIKGRLDQSGFLAQLSSEPSLFDHSPDALPSAAHEPSPPVVSAPRLGGRGGGEEPPKAPGHTNGAAATATRATSEPALTEAPAAASTPTRPPTSAHEPAETTTPPSAAASAEPPSAPAETPAAKASPGTRRAARGDLAGATFSAAELAGASGATPELIAALVEYGLLAAKVVAGVSCFDDDAVELARAAAGFARFGIEPRHLTAAKHAASRQAALYVQAVTPLLRQRNPDARARAGEDLRTLAELGSTLHHLLVDAALREAAGS